VFGSWFDLSYHMSTDYLKCDYHILSFLLFIILCELHNFEFFGYTALYPVGNLFILSTIVFIFPYYLTYLTFCVFYSKVAPLHAMVALGGEEF
jgi:hypothetical protein